MNPQRLIVISVAVIALVAAAFLIVPRLRGPGPAATLDYAAQPVAGSRTAPVQVGLFFDFLCPHCAAFGEEVTPLLKREYVDTGRAAIFFFNFPVVDPVASRTLAVAGECVARQNNDAFVTLEPILLRSQAVLRASTSRVFELASEYAPQLDITELRACVNGSQTAAAVDADVAAARGLNLGGTPSVTVNGQVVTNPTLENIRRAINAVSN